MINSSFSNLYARDFVPYYYFSVTIITKIHRLVNTFCNFFVINFSPHEKNTHFSGVLTCFIYFCKLFLNDQAVIISLHSIIRNFNVASRCSKTYKTRRDMYERAGVCISANDQAVIISRHSIVRVFNAARLHIHNNPAYTNQILLKVQWNVCIRSSF